MDGLQFTEPTTDTVAQQGPGTHEKDKKAPQDPDSHKQAVTTVGASLS